ncbi:MAG: efflux RND transporter periplasmic adaptor subunit [Pseudomonadota bacterium]
MKRLFCLGLVLALAACEDEDTATGEAPVRGLKTFVVSESEDSTIRRFPGVLEPTSLNTLSFDLAGKLAEMTLQVGQRVNAGDVLASLDPEALQVQVANAEAGVRSAQAAYDNSAETLSRQEELFERGTITRVSLDAAITDTATRLAQLEQAQANLETAVDNLGKSTLEAPFDAIVNSVDVQSFATIAAGTPIVSLYSPEAFEVSFSANFDTIDQLVVGSPASVRLADRPDLSLAAQVSELGARADAVSSFPIVLTLTESDPILKAGMAVEAAIELPLPTALGFSIPLTTIITDGQLEGDPQAGAAQVYVFDETSSTVERREIRIAGVRDNALLVISGLDVGDHVASAGVSFLRDGQEVKLLSDGE